MSRFVLTPEATPYSLGNLVLELAKMTFRPPDQSFDFNSKADLVPLRIDGGDFLSTFEGQIAGGAEFAVGDSVSPGTGAIDDGTLVVFHFDRTHTDADGNTLKVVNVAVPDLEGKYDPAIDETPGNPDLNGAAKESMGFIVYAHCS